MMVCRAYVAGDGFLKGLLDFVDCQAQTIGTQGYMTLAAPGSTVSQVLTAMLVLFVAGFGYRMLMGHTPGVRDGVMAMVKIGVVLTLAMNWPVYRTLVYQVILSGPAELTSQIGRGADLPGAGGGLAVRLDGVDQMIDRLAALGTGGITQPEPGTEPLRASQRVFTGFDEFAIGGARVAFLVGTVAAFALVRLAAGLLLALGPLFIAFLLFEGTRGLFAGWLRILAGTALASIGITIVLGSELLLLEPWLVDLLTQRFSNQGIAGVPAPLLAAILIFDLVLAGIIFLSMKVMMGLNLPISWPRHQGDLRYQSAGGLPAGIDRREPAGVPSDSRSRAAAIADAVVATQRREEIRGNIVIAGAARAHATGSTPVPASTAIAVASVPLGQRFRRTGTRISASAARRDRAR
ncbi:MAG: hypothetical protein EOP62_13100 [Sphingomonadales bacterium]|nr:MAG: hypothetical protein EOP62_13100 [Sphingomonadales bacterium]